MRVIGARTHNLKNIDVDIPRDSFVVITGKSGSGKSSLAIDTIFAEGQRQFVESLSLYSRQFFGQKSATDVDEVQGLQPTICINQNRGSNSPRSTVGTLTEVYDYLRLLFSKLGQIHCPDCGQTVSPQTIDGICEMVKSLPEKTKVMILAPMAVGRKGKHADVFEKIRKERLVRVRVDGDVLDINDVPELDGQKNHSIDAITDRIVVRDGIDDRLHESIEMATKLGNGSVTICYHENGDSWHDELCSTQFTCSDCGTSCPDLAPRNFSFNSPYGACEHCEGLGQIESFDIERVVPDRTKSMAEGAVILWNDLSPAIFNKKISLLSPLMGEIQVSNSDPISSLTDDQWKALLFNQDRKQPGLMQVLEQELTTCVDDQRFEMLETFRAISTCQACHGTRLNRYSNSVLVNGETISQLCSRPLEEAVEFFESVSFAGANGQIAEPILNSICNRLKYLVRVGVGYLSLNRSADSLSGGELQRVRLAKSIGSGLTGTCYVLDEPSTGLHHRDQQRLIDTIVELKGQGNSIVVVEHDEAMMRAADHIIDMGPEAGSKGGNVVACGTCDELRNDVKSVTGDYLANRKQVSRLQYADSNCEKKISIRGASGFNLKNVNVDVPLRKMVCVTGVSGSGKSTLIYKTLGPAVKQHLRLATINPEPFESIDGLQYVDKLVEVNQKPISRSPRGCAATYTGLFEDIRKIFAATKSAKQKGFAASRFSFNTKEGWCPACEGHGRKRVSMKLMPDIFVECDVCNGLRFNASTLSVRFRDLTIADVLKLSVDEALVEFDSFSKIRVKLHRLYQVGLGYLPLGQPSTTLSGGESQRIKLANELSKSDTGQTLYLLDEPTSGLHFDDIQKLLGVLSELVQHGNTVLVVEHDLDVIRSADWIIDLGPEGGDKGGLVIATGTPVDLMEVSASKTGNCLATTAT